MDKQEKKQLLLQTAFAAVKAVDPKLCIKKLNQENSLSQFIDSKPDCTIHVFGVGKAAYGMARGLQEILPSFSLQGFIIIPGNASVSSIKNIVIETSSHPIPNEKTIQISKKVLQYLAAIPKNDVLFFLLSGGASSLFEIPAIPLQSYQTVLSELLNRTVPIQDINIVRKHLSQVKGGKLLRQIFCPVQSFVLSDVVGDDLSTIGSGPMHWDGSTFQQALDILKKNKVKEPKALAFLQEGISGKWPETMKKQEFEQKQIQIFLLGSIQKAAEASKNMLSAKGIETKIMTVSLTGDAKKAGYAIGLQILETPKNTAFIFGGETTMQVYGKGKGGRNQELALAAATVIAGRPILLLSFGTDGIDGNSPAAGAIVDGDTLLKAKILGLDIEKFQKENDTFHFFEKIDGLIMTGPTGTNVGDLVIAWHYG
ncbi:MAG: glycerate kinase [Simkaniaceae bacterium]